MNTQMFIKTFLKNFVKKSKRRTFNAVAKDMKLEQMIQHAQECRLNYLTNT